jgi:isoleucyl-tRNA synthetase
VLALLQKVINEVTALLDNYQVTEAGRKLADFVTELSTWYVRRSRERFKAGGKDAGLARATLGFVLRQMAVLLAPFTPFVADELYTRVRGGLESVHLEDWLIPQPVDEKILEEMHKARQIVEQALAQRAEAGIKIRQPLKKLSVPAELSAELSALVAEEVNVKEVVAGATIKLDTALDESLKLEGLLREFTRQVNALRKQLKLTIKDKVTLVVEMPEFLQQELRKQLANVARAVIAEAIEFSTETQEHELDLGGVKVTISLKR